MFEVGKDILKNKSGIIVNHNSVRVRVLWLFFAGVFILFGLRTLWFGIQGTSRERYSGVGGTWLVNRADIVDRNGDLLAKNIMSGHIQLRLSDVKKPEEVARVIHDVFPFEYSLSDALKLVYGNKKFMYLKKYASDAQRAKIIDAHLEGLEVVPIQMRKYPKRRLFSHVIGFIGNEGRGLEGVERQYDKYLSENIGPLQLSLDSRIQSVMYEQLSIAMQKYQAKGAMGMLMNSRTGEMLAMVSLPDYDPEHLGSDMAENRVFKPLRYTYEMGSIFKVFNTAMALENGIHKEYYVKAPFKIPDKRGRVAATIHDVSSFKPPRPNLSVEEIMLHSCNVGSAQIALDLPEGTAEEFFHRIHLDKPLDLEFGRTERSQMPIKWGPVERATVSFGHGISVTPMHLLLAVNSMTNGGVYIYPTLEKRSVGVVRGERVLSDEISAKLRNVMFRIAEETTARKARIAGIEIGGKTGTAEKRLANGRSDASRNMTVFTGVFPVSAPQYIIMVVLDEPHGTKESGGWKTAAWNAVPTAGEILNSIIPLLFE